MYIHINYSFSSAGGRSYFSRYHRVATGQRLTRSMGTRLDAATDEAGAVGKKTVCVEMGKQGVLYYIIIEDIEE